MILKLILASVQSILQVMATVCFGYILTKAGYFAADKQKWLSRLNMVFFTPCLLFYNIASVMSIRKLVAYWPIPVFYITFITIVFSAVHIVCRIARIDKDYRGFVLACSMFMNTNSLPIAVIVSLAASEAGKTLYWDADDTQESVAARGISYVLFYAIFGNILRWSYGFKLLQFPHHRSDEEVHYQSNNTANDNTPSSDRTSPTVATDRRPSSTTSSRCQKHAYTTNSAADERTGLLSSFPTLSSDLDNADERKSVKRRIMDILCAIHQVMTPPLYAALLGLFVGLIPPLKSLFFDSFLYPSFTIAIQSCGKASIPIILMCLGSQLTEISQTSQSTAWRRKPVWSVVGIRLFLAPLYVIPIVVAFVIYCQQWSDIASDPVFSVMMIISSCTPTAINLVQISQVTGAYENEMLHLLFYSYGIVCVPVFTLVVFAALNIVDKLL